MKTYGYFCEDEAIETFIDRTLELIGPTTRCRGFVKHKNELTVPDGRNSAMIKKIFPSAIKIAFANTSENEKIDLFIISYDFDDTDIASFNHHIDQQKEKIDLRRRGKTIFCIPIQCIEYWLWYIKHSSDETPPLPNSIEKDATKKRSDMKIDIYGSVKTSRWTQFTKSQPILEQLNIERLESLSPSFKNFTNQIREFCNRG